MNKIIIVIILQQWCRYIILKDNKKLFVTNCCQNDRQLPSSYWTREMNPRPVGSMIPNADSTLWSSNRHGKSFPVFRAAFSFFSCDTRNVFGLSVTHASCRQLWGLFNKIPGLISIQTCRRGSVMAPFERAVVVSRLSMHYPHAILPYLGLLTELFLSVTAYIIVPLCGVSYVIIKRIYVCIVCMYVCMYKRNGKVVLWQFLADRTNGRAIGTVLRLSSVCRLWRYVLWLNGAS